jgi:hypothetical protein
MPDTIFSGDDQTEVSPQIQEPSPAFQVPTELNELVGDGKKYRSVEDALKSIPHAQTHIQNLENEMKQLREEVAKRKAAEELLEDLRNNPPMQQNTPTQQSPDIYQTVEAVITAREQQSRAKGNIEAVIGAFSSAFGDKAETQFVHLAQENGLSVQELNKLAATSPAAVLKLAGLGKQQPATPSKMTGSSVNTEGFQQGNQQPLSAKVPKGATTKDLVNAWRNAGETVRMNRN